MGDFWTRLIESAKGWDYAVIAAFIAVAVTLWVANSEARQRRRQLRQEAMLEINFQSAAWADATSEFLGVVRVYLEATGTTMAGSVTLPWSMSVLDPVTTATNSMDRALKAAHMTCGDYQVIGRVGEAELQLDSFLTLLRGPHPRDIPGLVEELTGVLHEGLRLVREFSSTTEALIRRGFQIYASPKGVRFRLRRTTAVTARAVKGALGRSIF